MYIEVWHKNEMAYAAPDTASFAEYRPVACVFPPDAWKYDGPWQDDKFLEQAWEATQNVMGSWWRGKTMPDGTPNGDFRDWVNPMPQEKGCRSSMVGDLFVIRHRHKRHVFAVAGVGFKYLETIDGAKEKA